MVGNELGWLNQWEACPQCQKSPITNQIRDFATAQMLAQARVSAQF